MTAPTDPTPSSSSPRRGEGLSGVIERLTALHKATDYEALLDDDRPLTTMKFSVFAHLMLDVRDVLAELQSLRTQLAEADSKLAEARRALQEATTPTYYGIDDNGVDADDLYALEVTPGTVEKVWSGRHLGDRWVACYETPDDEYACEVFDTEAEARAALDAARSPSPETEG